MLTLRTKIILFNTILFGTLLIGFAIVLYKSVQHNSVVRLDSNLEQYVSAFNRVLMSDLSETNFPDTNDFNELRGEGPKRITYKLFDENGSDIAGTLEVTMTNERLKGFSNLTINNLRYRCLAVELEPKAEKSFFLIAATPLDDISAGLNNLVLLFVVLIPICLIMAGFASWLIFHLSFRPLHRIIQTAQIITASNLETQLELPKARDEIRMLGKVFNEMITRLGAAFNSQKQFAADASHEIRTPLSIIRSELEFACRHELESSVKECIEISLSEIDLLAAMTEGLLTLAKLDARQIKIQRKPIHLNDLIEEIVKQTSFLAQKKEITITTKCLEHISLNADSEKLKRILFNLLDNAIKFSVRGGSVMVEQKLYNKNPEYVIISVIDNGPGIAVREQQNIFKRFYRSESTRQDNQGTGLGLAIATQLVNLHGGTISVESQEGKGARFSIKLPRS